MAERFKPYHPEQTFLLPPSLRDWLPQGHLAYFLSDLAGNRTLMQDEWGATYWDYDALGRPTRRHDPRGTVVTYGYGQGGHRTELTVEGQGTVYYEYGPTGSMDRLLDGKTGLFTYYEYDPAGRVRLQHHPNLPAGSVEGATATYFLYDGAGRLSEKVTVKDSDASVLVRFAYTRDAAGNPIAIEREPALGAFYYQYDALQRLAYEAQRIAGDREYENYYEYDAAGNRTLLRHGETDADDLTYYEYNAANELTSLHAAAGWTYFEYDGNGNTAMEQAPSYTRYYDWDGRDMLTAVRSTEAGWTDNVYRYDGLASRVSTLESGGLTYYDWDSINVIQEKDADGDVTDRQVHGYAPIFSVGDIALMDKSGTPYVPDFDQVGTTWNLLDSAAAKANSYAYDAFGVGRSASETLSNLYRFGTKRLDADPALYHFIARQYAAHLGRFAGRDRLGLLEALWVYTPSAGPEWTAIVRIAVVPSGGDTRLRAMSMAAFGPSGPWNLYTLGDNRPIAEVDPAGLWGEDLHAVLTSQWARQVRGFDITRGCATVLRDQFFSLYDMIGAADNAIDQGSTAPYPWPLRGDLTWHYGSLRKWHTQIEFAAAWRAAANSDCVTAIVHLGWALHPLQDTFSHSAAHHAVTWRQHITGPNAPWPLGGGPWRPDKVALWPGDVKAAEIASKALIIAFLSLPCNRCTECALVRH